MRRPLEALPTGTNAESLSAAALDGKAIEREEGV